MKLHRLPSSERETPAPADHLHRTPPCRRRLVGYLTALFVGIVLTGACLQALAITDESVYLYDASGTPVLCTSAVFQEPHIFQISPNVEIGTVTSDGHIVSDATGQIIGLIAPSQAATEELGQ